VLELVGCCSAGGSDTTLAEAKEHRGKQYLLLQSLAEGACSFYMEMELQKYHQCPASLITCLARVLRCADMLGFFYIQFILPNSIVFKCLEKCI